MPQPRIDPALAAAFESLPKDMQEAAMRREPRAGRVLRAAYLAEQVKRRALPNRAARRRAAAAMKRKATR
jgi:hypothetical protein